MEHRDKGNEISLWTAMHIAIRKKCIELIILSNLTTQTSFSSWATHCLPCVSGAATKMIPELKTLFQMLGLSSCFTWGAQFLQASARKSLLARDLCSLVISLPCCCVVVAVPCFWDLENFWRATHFSGGLL